MQGFAELSAPLRAGMMQQSLTYRTCEIRLA